MIEEEHGMLGDLPEMHTFSGREVVEAAKEIQEEQEAAPAQEAETSEEVEVENELSPEQEAKIIVSYQEMMKGAKLEMSKKFEGAKLSIEQINEIRGAFEELMNDASIEDGDTYADKAGKIVEAHYGVKKENAWEGFKNMGGQGMFANVAEAYHNAYKAVTAESPEEKAAYWKQSWRKGTNANPFLLIPEIVYRGTKFVFSDKEGRDFQKQEMHESFKNANEAYRYVTGTKEERIDWIEQKKAQALMMTDMYTLGKGAMEGVSLETWKVYKDSKKTAEVFTKRLDVIQKKLEVGEDVTIWDLSKEMFDASIKATGSSPEKVVGEIGKVLDNPDFINKLPENQRGSIELYAKLMQDEAGQKEIVKQLTELNKELEK
ncbi:MAG: hypothetical protein Q8P30_04365 [Candidatus Uhrbacteria bacterium]|nr:hypothetical protein [Candidatus Uhrbacteria bacterium]